MMRAALIGLLLVGGCASRPARVPVTVDEIVQMSRDGQPPTDIIARMEASDTVYRLSGSELARLKEQGVPDEVLDYMQDTYIDYERSRAVRSYDPWWGPPYAFGYPYWGYYGPYYAPYYYPYRPYRRPRPPKPNTETR